MHVYLGQDTKNTKHVLLGQGHVIRQGNIKSD